MPELAQVAAIRAELGVGEGLGGECLERLAGVEARLEAVGGGARPRKEVAGAVRRLALDERLAEVGVGHRHLVAHLEKGPATDERALLGGLARGGVVVGVADAGVVGIGDEQLFVDEAVEHGVAHVGVVALEAGFEERGGVEVRELAQFDLEPVDGGDGVGRVVLTADGGGGHCDECEQERETRHATTSRGSTGCAPPVVSRSTRVGA